jgi:hypothetical protein
MNKKIIILSIIILAVCCIIVSITILPKNELIKVNLTFSNRNIYVLKIVNKDTIKSMPELYNMFLDQMNKEGYIFIEAMGGAQHFAKEGESKIYIFQYPKVIQFKWFY